MLVRCPRCDRVAGFERRPGRTPDAHGVRYPERRITSSRSTARLVCRSRGLSPIETGLFRPWGAGSTREAHRLPAPDLAAGRHQAPGYETGPKPTPAARLPAGIKGAKNRAEVPRAVDRTRASVTAG